MGPQRRKAYTSLLPFKMLLRVKVAEKRGFDPLPSHHILKDVVLTQHASPLSLGVCFFPGEKASNDLKSRLMVGS